MADKKTTSFANQHGQDWETKEISVYGAAKAFIGQLGVGMDLTHVSIPAIFLLPYSILEFISIRMSKMFHYLLPLSKEPDPRKRLEGVMIFLLGSGQEEDLLLNHKPTNPIIGETHKARIDHEDGSHSYVLCEQTVHHPPTSAFDIYNPTHGVRLAGNMLFGVLFHHNSVTVETKGGLKVYLTLPDGSTEVYLMEAGVPDIYIKNVLLGTKYVYWTGNLHINCPSSGWNAQMAFGYKDSKNTINGVIWNAFQKGEKVEKKKEEKQSQGWASRWAKGAVTAAKSTAKFTTGWLYDQEGEDGWMANTKLFFDPEDVLARFSGSSGVECWVYPGGLQRKAEGTPKQTKKEKTETPPQERYLLFNGKDLVPKECDVYPDPENLEENSSLTIWKAVGEAIVRGDVEAADVEKTKVEEKQRAERATLPDSYRRPQNDQALEHFIRAKYEAKKYILKGWIPPKVDVNDLPPLTEPAKSAKKFVAIGNLAQPAAQSSQAPPPKREESLVDLFDTPASTAPVQSNDLFSLNSPAKVPETPSGGDLDDLFGPIVSAPTQNAPQPDSSGLADGLAGLNFSTPATDGKKTTDDIMSLFNNPPPPNNLNQFYAPPPQQPPAAQFPSAFGQAPAQNLPQNNWAANWSTPAQPPVLIPSQPPVMAAMPPQSIGNQPQLANPGFAGFAAPVQTKPADSKAFEDLFSQAQIQFQKTDFSAPKPQQPVATTAPSAQNDLESLFM